MTVDRTEPSVELSRVIRARTGNWSSRVTIRAAIPLIVTILPCCYFLIKESSFIAFISSLSGGSLILLGGMIFLSDYVFQMLDTWLLDEFDRSFDELKTYSVRKDTSFILGFVFLGLYMLFKCLLITGSFPESFSDEETELAFGYFSICAALVALIYAYASDHLSTEALITLYKKKVRK